MIIRSIYFAVLCATALANTEEGAHKAHSKSLESSSDCTRTYKVVKGDTCDKISALKGVSTHQLAIANKKINSGCTNLVIGDTLCLGLKGQDCTKVHIVKETDICFSIAKLAGIPLDVLYKNNPNINKGCTNIYPGEVLCIAGTVNATDAHASGIKGIPHFPSYNSSSNSSTTTLPFEPPALNLTQPSTHQSHNGPFGIPSINLTDSIAHLRNITHKAFNASSVSSFLNSTFHALNLTNSSSPTPISGLPNDTFTLPPMPLPHFNHTRNGAATSSNLTEAIPSPNLNPAFGTGSDSIGFTQTPNPMPTTPLVGDFSLPPFSAAFPTRSLGNFNGAAATAPSPSDSFGFGASANVMTGPAENGAFGSLLEDPSFLTPTLAASAGAPITPPMPF